MTFDMATLTLFVLSPRFAFRLAIYFWQWQLVAPYYLLISSGCSFADFYLEDGLYLFIILFHIFGFFVLFFILFLLL